jgi:molecular chaperone DnaK
MVALSRKNEIIYGNAAKRQFISNSKHTIWGFKRLVGRTFSSDEVSQLRQRTSFKIIEHLNDTAGVRLGEKIYAPEEISGLFLRYLRKRAEEYLGEKINDTVITVPAFFNDNQRQATKMAGEIADLNVLRIVNEPTAALIAYKNKIEVDGLYAVYDLGGGTFDISIVEVKKNVHKVISTSGDTFLGGSDFDNVIVEWILDEILEQTKIDLSEDKNNLQRITQAAEKAKIELSFEKETTISIPYLFSFSNGTNYHFKKKILRSQLEEGTMDFIQRTIDLISDSLDDINIQPSRLERMILVGGQSRMPLIQKVLTEYLGKEPYSDVNPEEVVAQGAVLQGEIISGKFKEILLLDVTPLSLGVETKADGFEKIIDKNSTIPIRRSKTFTTISDNQTTVKIHVLQGERLRASDNISLGNFELQGIPPAPKGIPQIEVSFQIDVNGIVKVSAKDKKTGKIQSMKVQPSCGLTAEQVEQLKKEAIDSEQRDKDAIELTKTWDQLAEELKSVKFFFNRHNEHFSGKVKRRIKGVIDSIEKTIDLSDTDSLKEKLEEIQKTRIEINSILAEKLKGK